MKDASEEGEGADVVLEEGLLGLGPKCRHEGGAGVAGAHQEQVEVQRAGSSKAHLRWGCADRCRTKLTIGVHGELGVIETGPTKPNGDGTLVSYLITAGHCFVKGRLFIDSRVKGSSSLNSLLERSPHGRLDIQWKVTKRTLRPQGSKAGSDLLHGSLPSRGPSSDQGREPYRLSASLCATPELTAA